jgi:hypothetical protein
VSLSKPAITKLALYAAALLACGLTMLLYTHPEVVISLADQLWACF